MPAYWYASVGIRRTFDADGAICSMDAMAMGPTETPYDYRPAPRTELIGLAIQPEWTTALIDLPAREIEREHVWPDPAPILDAALHQAHAGASAQTIAKALGQDVLKRLAHAQTPERRVRAALSLLRRSGGRVRVRALATRLDTCERQLRRSLKDAIGLAPKPYARLLRFNAMLDRADRDPAPNWSGLAAECGYSDQAHLVREAAALAGAAPARLHAERRGESDFFNTPV